MISKLQTREIKCCILTRKIKLKVRILYVFYILHIFAVLLLVCKCQIIHITVVTKQLRFQSKKDFVTLPPVCVPAPHPF